MTHKLLQYKAQVDKTHRGLGRLYSFVLMTTKARKVAIIIAIAGSGKTTAIKAAANVNAEGQIFFDAITRSGIKPIEKKLNGFQGVFVINDLGNIDTSYAEKESIKVACSLTYEHQLSKLNSSINLNIENYYGSFVTSAQPVIMPRLINTVDWEAVIRDKTMRFYQMIRPTTPNKNPISIKVKWGKKIEQVKYKKIKSPLYDELFEVGLSQWGLSRTNEHIEDLLKACAALDNRTVVNLSDIKCALELTRPMRIEQYMIEKHGFESGKEFLHDHICMLTEFATYKQVTKKQIADDFFVSMRNVNRLLQNVRELYIEDPKDDNVLLPSENTTMILEEGGYL